MPSDSADIKYMHAAIAEAKKAGAKGEVPIGAVAVIDDTIVACAHNMREADHNPLGHAEVLLLQQLSSAQQRWRLDDVSIYVTCEPCLMCAGAMLQARITRIVYGCADPKAGACASLYHVVADDRLNHQIPTTGGVCGEECGALLSAFFQKLRTK